MKKEHMIWLGVGLAIGVMASAKLRQLPGVGKLPSF